MKKKSYQRSPEIFSYWLTDDCFGDLDCSKTYDLDCSKSIILYELNNTIK